MNANQMQTDAPIISSYDNGGFLFGDYYNEGSVLIAAGGAGSADEEQGGFSILPWPVTTADAITPNSLKPIYSAPPMLILLGIGGEMPHPFLALRSALSKNHLEMGLSIAIEIQTTMAAARTWNLLLSEGRKVAFAALALPHNALPNDTQNHG